MVGKCLSSNSRAKLWESQILLWRSCRIWSFCRGLELNPGFICDSKNMSVILSGQISRVISKVLQISGPYFQSISGYQWLWRRTCCLFGGQSRTLHSWMTCSRWGYRKKLLFPRLLGMICVYSADQMTLVFICRNLDCLSRHHNKIPFFVFLFLFLSEYLRLKILQTMAILKGYFSV